MEEIPRNGYLTINFGKRNTTEAGTQPEIFRGRGGFVKVVHFDKHFVKNSRKKGPTGKI